MILIQAIDVRSWNIEKVGLGSYFKLINFVNTHVVFLKCNVLGMAPKSEVFNESFNLNPMD